MILRSRLGSGRSGQSITESLILFPFYFLMVFGVLQMAQLGVGALVIYYSASTIARKTAQNSDSNVQGVLSKVDADNRSTLATLMVAGMQPDQVWACNEPGESTHTPTITVNATAKINAFPFVGLMLNKALGNRYSGSSLGRGLCPGSGSFSSEPPALGPFYFVNTPPYYFIVRGEASARMNYH